MKYFSIIPLFLFLFCCNTKQNSNKNPIQIDDSAIYKNSNYLFLKPHIISGHLKFINRYDSIVFFHYLLKDCDTFVINTTNRFNKNNAKLIDSLKLNKIIEDLKWRIYCTCCHDTLISRIANLKTDLTFGEFKLDLIDFSINKHIYTFSYLLHYNKIYYDATIFCCSRFYYKIDYDIKKNKIIYIYAPAIDLELGEGKNKDNINFFISIQPEAISYIRNNSQKIDPWFLTEAKKRGVFDSTKYK